MKKVFTFLLTLGIGVSMIAGCGNSADTENTAQVTDKSVDNVTADNESTSITITHAYGETVIKGRPQRVVTLGWGNQDTPLALGIAPVGVSMANFGYVTENNLHQWTDDAFKALGAEPVVFKDVDGFDYEAISDCAPDVIIASYSGMTEEEYKLLSEIAPTVPFKDKAWQTNWREQTVENAEALGMKEEGEKLVADTDKIIADAVAKYPELEGLNAGFFWIDTNDLSSFYAYLPNDPRCAFLQDLGFTIPDSVLSQQVNDTDFSVTLSREYADQMSDVDVMIVYGDESLLEALQEDELMSTIPAVRNGAVVLLDSTTAMAAATTPSVLSIPNEVEDYLDVIDQAYTGK